MANIYEITNQFPFLKTLEESGEIDPEAIMEALEVAKEELADKLEDYCKVIKNFEAEISGLKSEEERLKARRQVKENAIKNMKEAMKMALMTAFEGSSEKKMTCGTFTCAIQKNPESVVLDETCIDNIPETYLKFKEPEIDKAKLKEDIKSGKNLDGIAHLEQTFGLRIR